MTDVNRTQAPIFDEDSERWWKALQTDEFVLPQCVACELVYFPPMPNCPSCGAPDQTHDRPSAGIGSVYSWVTIYHAFDPAFAVDVPYVIASVEFDDGPRMLGRFLERELSPEPGMRVKLCTYEDSTGWKLPGFRPIAPV